MGSLLEKHPLILWSQVKGHTICGQHIRQHTAGTLKGYGISTLPLIIFLSFKFSSLSSVVDTYTTQSSLHCGWTHSPTDILFLTNTWLVQMRNLVALSIALISHAHFKEISLEFCWIKNFNLKSVCGHTTEVLFLNVQVC